MTSERDTRQSIKEGRAVERAADRVAREADEMQQRSEKLGEGIDQARQDWERKRADQKVPGANPPEHEAGLPEDASHPSEEEDDQGENTAGPANP